MSSTKSRGGSCNPFGCLLFLIGLGSLIIGLANGTVLEAVNDLLTNSPESTESLKILIIWAFITFGPLGLGSIWIRSSGLGVSILIFGLLLVLGGLSGLGAFYLGTVIPQSDNVFWQVVNYLIGLTGSLLYSSIALTGAGIILVIFAMLFDTRQRPRSDRPTGVVQMVTCELCGHQNPVWMPRCEKCGAQLSMAKNNSLW